ncbi:ssDNA endodeoxyribonuclease [Ascosphaera acerosa]|nr:ssDNA endodeoxyribonuclease [Ascosphaera acerosa]
MPIQGPLFSAVSASTQHLYLLLRCIGFAPKALVHVTPEGIRFLVEDGRVMQGLALLDKSLFENYIFSPCDTRSPLRADADGLTTPAGDVGDAAGRSSARRCRFVVSLGALLETLQILGLGDDSRSQFQRRDTPVAGNAFSAPAMLFDQSCTISYMQPGSPLSITLAESGVTTTCELTAYEVEDTAYGGQGADGDDDDHLQIPLQRDAITFKTIMRSTWLHNAVTELAATDPTVLTLSASATHTPFFALSGSGGPFSDSVVEFSVPTDVEAEGTVAGGAGNGSDRRTATSKGSTPAAPMVTETFQVRPPDGFTRVRHRYKFALIRKALGAMAVSSKVSMRCDCQGVLSLQFMIELGDGAQGKADASRVSSRLSSAVSFVDFKFVPLTDDDDEGDTQSENE